MRSLWAAVAAFLSCLALAVPIAAQPATPAATTSPATSPPAEGTATGTITVQVRGLVGLEGLELAGRLSSVPSSAAEGGFFDSAIPIDSSSFATSTQTAALEGGTYELLVFAGQPPCAWGYGPMCGEWQDPPFACSIAFDIVPEQDLTILISGLPEADWDVVLPSCPVSAVLGSLLAPSPSLDPSLVADADGFVFDEVEPGVHRLVTDGAGHFPSATYIREARDMDQLALGEDGRVLVWSTTHGIDNRLGGDSQLWILGVEGILAPDAAPRPSSDDPRPWGEPLTREAADGSTWKLGDYTGGVTRTTGGTSERFLSGYFLNSGLVITPDGRAWVAVGHESGESGGIYVIDSDAHGEPVEDPAS